MTNFPSPKFSKIFPITDLLRLPRNIKWVRLKTSDGRRMRNYVEEVLFLSGAHGREEGERGLIKNFGAEPELEAFCYGKGHQLKEVAFTKQEKKRIAECYV